MKVDQCCVIVNNIPSAKPRNYTGNIFHAVTTDFIKFYFFSWLEWLSGSLIIRTRLKDRDDKDFCMSNAGNIEVCLIEVLFLRASKASSKRDS